MIFRRQEEKIKGRKGNVRLHVNVILLVHCMFRKRKLQANVSESKLNSAPFLMCTALLFLFWALAIGHVVVFPFGFFWTLSVGVSPTPHLIPFLLPLASLILSLFHTFLASFFLSFFLICVCVFFLYACTINGCPNGGKCKMYTLLLVLSLYTISFKC